MSELKTAAQQSRTAQQTLQGKPHSVRCGAIKRLAELIANENADLLAGNEQDVSAAVAAQKPQAFIDRLLLTKERLEGLSQSLLEVVSLPDPLGRSTGHTHSNGMSITKTTVPLGVIAAIYESRPNVTADIAALAIKSGNGAILRGGSECKHTNAAMATLIARALRETAIDEHLIYVVKDTSRATADEILTLRGYIDLLIPRGGAGLIKHTVENSKVPVIETGAGICHVYVDSAAKLDMALDILVNAKTHRPSVCNAAETLLCHKDVAKQFLPMAKTALDAHGVLWHGCEKTAELLGDVRLADEQSFATEYNDLELNCRVVSDVNEAAAHIARYGTMHSEAIVTEDMHSAETFMLVVDAAVVYHNASTRFTDGGEFGLGAEIGISTQKLPPRGPMGPDVLTTVKYFVKGCGQVR